MSTPLMLLIIASVGFRMNSFELFYREIKSGYCLPSLLENFQIDEKKESYVSNSRENGFEGRENSNGGRMGNYSIQQFVLGAIAGTLPTLLSYLITQKSFVDKNTIPGIGPYVFAGLTTLGNIGVTGYTIYSVGNKLTQKGSLLGTMTGAGIGGFLGVGGAIGLFTWKEERWGFITFPPFLASLGATIGYKYERGVCITTEFVSAGIVSVGFASGSYAYMMVGDHLITLYFLE